MSKNVNLSDNLTLASASSRRIDLLRQINVSPQNVIPADINETPYKAEKPHLLAQRLSEEKAKAVFEQNKDHFVLAADTVVACGQQLLDKAETAELAQKYLEKLSGRRHHVYGGITLITPKGRILTRLCKTMVQFKRLTLSDIEAYIGSNEWDGKAGGYAIQGFAGSFVKRIDGSYSNVVGLCLYETKRILSSGGYVLGNDS
jgi:septum formation protein